MFCGIIRTLGNALLSFRGEKVIDFTYKRDQISFLPQQLFHPRTIAGFGLFSDRISNPAFENVKKFCYFLQQYSSYRELPLLGDADIVRINQHIKTNGERTKKRLEHPAQNATIVQSLANNLSLT